MVKMSRLSKRYTIERSYINKGNARSGQRINKVRFIVAHETATKASAMQNRTHFNNNQPSASAHTFVDDCMILEIVPIWEKAWHVHYDKPTDNKMFGDDANDCAIGVELCRTKFQESYDRYVWYIAYLCKHFGLDPKKDIVSHKTLDPQRRSDPESWLNPNGVTWTNFINHVTSYVNQWDVEPQPTYSLDAIPVKSDHTYRLAKFIDTTDTKLIEELKKDGYRIIDTPK